MPLEAVTSETSFGYLSTWDSTEHGCLGGYLVVSSLGRPLEFHCTAPVNTSRAQQILYGPTLWPYVLGEQIGGTLLKEAKLRPDVILVDNPVVYCLQSRASVPLVRLVASGGDPTCGTLDGAACEKAMSVGGYVCEFAPECQGDPEVVRGALATLAQYVDLAEPFERIREAIREAQRLGATEQPDAYRDAA